jgi:hypothetical protein
MELTNLTKIRASFELLTHDIEALLREGANIVTRREELEEFERGIRDKEQTLEAKKRAHEQDVEKVKEERAFVVRANREVVQRELAVKGKEAQLPDIKKMELEAEERIKAARREEDRIEEKKKELAELEAKSESLIAQQAAVDKEKAMDRQRKQILDLREEKISKEEARIRRLSEAV